MVLPEVLFEVEVGDSVGFSLVAVYEIVSEWCFKPALVLFVYGDGCPFVHDLIASTAKRTRYLSWYHISIEPRDGEILSTLIYIMIPQLSA